MFEFLRPIKGKNRNSINKGGFKMKESCRIAVSEVVNFMKDYGWDYSLSEKLEESLTMYASLDDLVPVKTYLCCGGSRRSFLIRYILQAYDEEVSYEEYELRTSTPERIELFSLKRKEAERRNKVLFEEKIFDFIDRLGRNISFTISREYSDLGNLFECKFNRVPKKLDVVKKAAFLSNVDPIEVVNYFDMKVINCLKKKGIENINIFMFIFKNPWMKKGDAVKLSKKEVLELSRSKSNEEIRRFRSFLVKKEGIDKASKIYKDIEVRGFHRVPTTFCYLEDEIEEIAEYASTEEIVELLKYNNSSTIISILNSCYMRRVKDGEITLLEASDLAVASYDVDKIMVEHDLKDAPVVLGREKAGIMAWDDLRQVFLGNYTHCCQKFGDAGESSMLFGLVSKHSGFFTIKRSEKVLAQAWVWEAKADTLVLDNIELADCREVDQFIDILYMWVKNSPYKNIQLGLGYSDMKVGKPMTRSEIKYYSLFRSRAFTKKVKSFFKGEEIYTDAQERRNWLKKGGEMQFFGSHFKNQEEIREYFYSLYSQGRVTTNAWIRIGD